MEHAHTHDNDNEELSFITLSAATKNVIRYLQGNEEDQKGSAEKRQRAENNEDYIAARLRDLRAFENRFISGNENRPRRRKG